MTKCHRLKIQAAVQSLCTAVLGRKILAERSGYSGRKYGNWTVLGDAPDRIYVRKSGKRRGQTVSYRWVVTQCECGFTKETALNSLVRGETKKCATCSKKENGIKLRNYDLNHNYGDWTVLNHFYKNGRGRMYCECICKCGFKKFIEANDLRRGRTSRCLRCTDIYIRSSLSHETVNLVRKLIANGDPLISISKELKIKYYTVKNIKYGKSYVNNRGRSK